MMNKLALSIFRISSSVAAILFFLAVLDMPYGFYTFVRLSAMLVSVFAMVIFYSFEQPHWVVMFSVIAILFNPIVPIHMSKSIWIAADLISAVIMLVGSQKSKNL
jgi:hypothetical protein